MRYLIPTMPMMFCGIDLRLHAGSLRAGHPFWIFSRHLPTLCRTRASQGADGIYGVSSARVTNGLVPGIAEVLVPPCGSRCAEIYSVACCVTEGEKSFCMGSLRGRGPLTASAPGLLLEDCGVKSRLFCAVG